MGWHMVFSILDTTYAMCEDGPLGRREKSVANGFKVVRILSTVGGLRILPMNWSSLATARNSSRNQGGMISPVDFVAA